MGGRGFPRLNQLFRWRSRALAPISSTFSRTPRTLWHLRRGGRRASFGRVMSDRSWPAEEAWGITEHFRAFHFERKGSQVRRCRSREARLVVRSQAHILGAPEAVWFGLKPCCLRGRPPAPRRELSVRRAVRKAQERPRITCRAIARHCRDDELRTTSASGGEKWELDIPRAAPRGSSP